MHSQDFSLPALYDALNSQRLARGITWAEATRQMSGRSGKSAGHTLSVSTVRATRIRRNAEGDGVLAMLRWLKRTPESFLPGYQAFDEERTRLPVVPSGKVMRFDTKRIYAALDTQRVEQDLTWVGVAHEIGASPSMLTHLSKGSRTGFPGVMRILGWLNRPCADFVRFTDR